MSTRNSWLRSPNPELRAVAEETARFLRDKRIAPDRKMRAVAEIVGPILEDRLALDDIWAEVLDQEDWTGTPVGERVFRMPDEIVGATHVLTYVNGVTLPVATFNRRQVGVQMEEIATPAFPVDVRELERTDPIVTLQAMTDATERMISIHKARRGYYLVADGFDDPTTNLEVIIDDGTYDDTGNFIFIRTLRDKIEEVVEELQDSIGGRPPIWLLSRQITLDRLKRVGLNADFGSLPGPDAPEGGGKEAALINLRTRVFPAGRDDVNNFLNRGRPIFTEGDVLLLGPNVGKLAEVEPLEPSTIQRDHWQAEYAWRMGHSWIRWSDKGDLNKTRRILYIRKVAAGATRGVLTADALSANGAVFYGTRPIDKSTVSNTTVIVSASAGGAAATGALTANLRGDLRTLEVTFATPLTPGTTYFIRSTTGLKDLAADDYTAMAEVQMQAG
jgi:hypothetical protein